MSEIKRQKGAPNGKWHIAHAHDDAPARAIDRLRCDQGILHDVDMEHHTYQGVRTGRMAAYCRTCQRWVAPTPQAPPVTPTEMRDQRQAARLTQALRRNDATARREYILRALHAGDRQKDIAERLGLTPQRVSQIVRTRRKSA